jgi:Protein of unknown function (DUF3618)
MTSDPASESAAEQTGPPDSPEQLRAEIERTREQLGDTVDQLAAKADVKAQAQAKVAGLTQRAKDTADQVRQRAADTAGQARQQAADAAGQARQRAADATGQVRQHAADATGQARQHAADTVGQARQQAAAVAGTGQEQLQARTPESVQRAASAGAAKARQYRTQLAVAAGSVGAVVLGFVLIRRRRQR